MPHEIKISATGRKMSKEELSEYYANLEKSENERHEMELERLKNELEIVLNGVHDENSDSE